VIDLVSFDMLDIENVDIKVTGLGGSASKSVTKFLQFALSNHLWAVRYTIEKPLGDELRGFIKRTNRGSSTGIETDLGKESNQLNQIIVDFIERRNEGRNNGNYYDVTNRISQLDYEVWYGIQEMVQKWVSTSLTQGLAKVDLDSVAKDAMISSDRLGGSCASYELIDTLLSVANKRIKSGGYDPFVAPEAERKWWWGGIRLFNIQLEGLSSMESESGTEARKDKDGSINVHANVKFPLVTLNSNFTFELNGLKTSGKVNLAVDGISTQEIVRAKKVKSKTTLELLDFTITKLGTAFIRVTGLSDNANKIVSAFLQWAFNNFNWSVLYTLQTPIGQKLREFLMKRNEAF